MIEKRALRTASRFLARELGRTQEESQIWGGGGQSDFRFEREEFERLMGLQVANVESELRREIGVWDRGVQAKGLEKVTEASKMVEVFGGLCRIRKHEVLWAQPGREHVRNDYFMWIQSSLKLAVTLSGFPAFQGPLWPPENIS